ncbi:hypothetical protein ACOCEA_05470 [Maribacter sp. CXY002]|uniref:hypothetical protein n=1 Tax=Maribacter luteocoastalis TaxID=3407671 RepID=UPI003B6759F4
MLVWLFAIVAPSMVSYLSDEDQTVISFNLNEEEQQEQDQKSTAEEKFVKENSLDISFLKFHIKSSIKDLEYIKYYNHTLEVQSPPPKHIC